MATARSPFLLPILYAYSEIALIVAVLQTNLTVHFFQKLFYVYVG